MSLVRKIIFAILITAVITAVIYCIYLKIQNKSEIAKKITSSVILNFQTPKIENIKILFVGDLMFDRGIRYYAEKNGGNEFIFDKISATLKDNDLVVANLEGPITDNLSISAGSTIASKNNYFFTFDKSVAKTLFNENIKLVNLGNNHILNFDQAGLKSTKKYLDEAKVDYFGAPDYPKSISTEIKGVKITFINYNEFSTIGELDQKATLEEIQKAKGFSDIIIIFCHWGNEYQLMQSDSQTNLAHQFIDAGADFVVGSHPHVIQPMEEYKGKRIYYSLGNFIFDQYFDNDVRNGLGVIVKINSEKKQLEFKEIKFYLQSGGQTIIKD